MRQKSTVDYTHVTINKCRIKMHNAATEPTYYLKDGTEFQLELFNPTTEIILAQIELDGKIITQGGLVLKPGERIYLERYLDIAKKFLFETYEVDGENEQVLNAIQKNGTVKVFFYKEIIFRQPTLSNTNWGGLNDNNNIYYRNNIGAPYINLAKTRFGSDTTLSANCFFNQSPPNLISSNTTTSTYSTYSTDLNNKSSSTNLPKSFLTNLLMTGRVEMGSKSDQKFTSVSNNFSIIPFHTERLKLLPLSQRIVEGKDIQINAYCTECGCKQKKGFKFCPSCGNKN